MGVVGCGIVGASLAYFLSQRGAEVVVWEGEEPASRATGKSFAWINATFDKEPRAYFDLHPLQPRPLAMAGG